MLFYTSSAFGWLAGLSRPASQLTHRNTIYVQTEQYFSLTTISRNNIFQSCRTGPSLVSERYSVLWSGKSHLLKLPKKRSRLLKNQYHIGCTSNINLMHFLCSKLVDNFTILLVKVCKIWLFVLGSLTVWNCDCILVLWSCREVIC